MIDLNTAIRIVREQAPLMPAATRPLSACLGHYLARPLITEEPVPLFDDSAMDGFLVHAADLAQATESSPVSLGVAGEIRAGQPPTAAPARGEAFRIYTGAPVPPGPLAVVKIEDTDRSGTAVRIKSAAKEGDHVRRSGREFEKGETVLPAGRLITPPVVGALASLGCTEVPVRDRPRVALIVTGDEFVSSGESPGRGRIRDANSHSLTAALEAMHLQAGPVLHARDRKESVKDCFQRAMEEADVVISTGGVSMGKYDLVRDVLHALGVEELFWRVAVKPGKPNYLGKIDSTLIFGLPGNTVSSMVSFYLFPSPALRWMQGWTGDFPLLRPARLRTALTKHDDRIEWVRGFLVNDGQGESWVQPVKGRGSHMLGHLALADCLIRFPREESRMEERKVVEILPLKWSQQ